MIKLTKFLKNSDIDISRSGKYMVRSNNSKVFLTDFNTQEVLKTINAKYHITRDISDNEAFCVFTSKGEECLNVLKLPDLEEVASIDTNYIFDVNFAPDSDNILFFEKNSNTRECRLNKWDFKTNQKKTLYINDNTEEFYQHSFCINDSFYIMYTDNYYTIGKYKIISEGSFAEYTIEGCESGFRYDYMSCSQIFNSKILISKINRNNFKDQEIGIYNVEDKSYTPLFKKKLNHLFWITEELFWYNDIYSSGVMNLTGEVLMAFDNGAKVAQCSNDNYLLCSSPFGTYIFEKTP